MGLDLYIEALIKEKKTGRIISNPYPKKYAYGQEWENGFFEVCWWCGHKFGDIIDNIIDICNSHMNTDYTNKNYEIPIPQSALRDIYALLVKRFYLPDDEEFEILPCNIEWEEHHSYEHDNLVNADKLSNIIYQLQCIEHYNDPIIDMYIPDSEDKKAFNANPKNYEWQFRLLIS